MSKLRFFERLKSKRLSWSLGLLVVAASLVAAVLWYSNRQPPQATLESALARLEQGDFSAAKDVLKSLKAKPDQSSNVALLRGAMLLKKGYEFPALDELQTAVDDPRSSQRANVYVGEAWYRLGRQLEAQAAWQKVLIEAPDAVEANRWMAASHYDQGSIHEALHYLRRTAELAPDDPRPHRLLGLIYKDYERYDDAIPCYKESLRRRHDQPSADEIRQELAACQLKQRSP